MDCVNCQESSHLAGLWQSTGITARNSGFGEWAFVTTSKPGLEIGTTLLSTKIHPSVVYSGISCNSCQGRIHIVCTRVCTGITAQMLMVQEGKLRSYNRKAYRNGQQLHLWEQYVAGQNSFTSTDHNIQSWKPHDIVTFQSTNK